jgi:hypothetical protein
MDKEFISYEQALALKELGFDEPCIGWYNPQVNYKKVTTDKYWAFHLTGEWENFKPAPLYQQAFRWFREKHNFWVEIKVEDNVKLGEQTFYWSIFGEYKTLNEKSIIRCLTDSDVDGKTFKTYEEAESACLDKLIEIVKNKKTN